ncbi:MAG TPA: AMP-binding protein, partial [Deltaproteobacteria bacterium]|nr:AMP-binding protein [Deltaproteobacteria bacterium]
MTNVLKLSGQHYQYQLTIGKLLASAAATAPDQEIVYRDLARMTYRDLIERINRLAGALAKLGVKQGDTISVFDYDSHRYLESYFAIPMMGAVLHTMNWRLSPEQIEYTMNHAEASVVMIHEDFLPLLESIRDKLTRIKKIILLKDSTDTPQTSLVIDAEYEDMLAKADPPYTFPELDENTKATTFYTTGTTGLPKGVYFSHKQLVVHTLSVCITVGCYDTPVRFSSTDVYMPITPMFHVHAWG